MRALVTGGAGFVGSVLVRRLLDDGHAVRVVDCGFFGLEHVDSRAELIAGNILDFEPNWLDSVDAVIHLAGLSNDPMADFSPSLNYIVNAAGTAIVAQATKKAGIGRFIFSSTCSVYGLDDSGPLNEDHPASPPFPYGISKLMAERLLLCLTDGQFRPIILRKGTVVGLSPRMRYDLVTNAMIKMALTENRIVVHNPGLWRPLIDVEDACEAYVCALRADSEVSGIFNVSTRNYTLDELSGIVANGVRAFGVDVAIHIEHRTEVRSYRVTTQKATDVLRFTPSKSMETTVHQVTEYALAQLPSDLEHPRHYNIRQLELMLADGTLHMSGRRGAAAHAPVASLVG